VTVSLGNYSLYTLQCESRGVSYETALYVQSFSAVLIVWDAGSALGWWVFGVTALEEGRGFYGRSGFSKASKILLGELCRID